MKMYFAINMWMCLLLYCLARHDHSGHFSINTNVVQLKPAWSSSIKKAFLELYGWRMICSFDYVF